jgi:hypothetical protein
MRRFNLFALLVFVVALGWVFTFDTPATRNIQNKVMALFSPFTRTGAGVQEQVVSSREPTPEAATHATRDSSPARRRSQAHATSAPSKASAALQIG